MKDLTIPLILMAHKALEMGPRKYAPHPTADEPREEEPARGDYESDEQWFLEQQCPADSNFR